jgi:hypothetical protein
LTVITVEDGSVGAVLWYWFNWTPEELAKVREVVAASEGGQKGITARVEKYLKTGSRDQVLK